MYDSLFCTYKPKIQRHSKDEVKRRARQHFRVLPGNLYPIHHLTHAELRRGYLNSRDLFFYAKFIYLGRTAVGATWPGFPIFLPPDQGELF